MFQNKYVQSLNKELFESPSAEYRGIPFWSWNCKITKELIDWQLDCFQEMGFGGADIHARSGLDTEYLGEEFMQLVRYTVDRCKEKGLYCWLYDEDRFPSGAAGGIVTKDWRNRGRFLLLTEKHNHVAPHILPGYCPNQQTFDKAVAAGQKTLGYFATAYALVFVEGCLVSYRRLHSEVAITDALAHSETVRFAYVRLMDEEEWFGGQTYVDTMNPEAVQAFIRSTYDVYHNAVGEEFGKTIPAIFTDEPRIGKHAQITCALSQEDVAIPYTEHFAATMQASYAIDPLDIAPEYVWELPQQAMSRNRYLYHETATECFVSAFMDQLCHWCKQHGIAMTGHVISEETLSSQTYAIGEAMRNYRNMDIPGIDILADFHEFATVKQAVSVTKQNGKVATVSELYGVTHWDCTFKTYKLQGDWQAALGITVRVPHLSHMSLAGEAKRDWPASIFFHSPWYREFSYVETYFARLNTVLTRGKAITRLAVVHPIESMWTLFGPNDQTLLRQKSYDSDFNDMVHWLLYGTLDFDFVSEALLPEQCTRTLQAAVPMLSIGEMAYSTVLVPNLLTIRGTTLDQLEAFCNRGGCVIFMGNVPSYVDAVLSNRAQVLAKRCIQIPKDRNALLCALESEQDVQVRTQCGNLSNNVLYQLRQDDDCQWLFLCHVIQKQNNISVPEHYTVRLKGVYAATQYNALEGTMQQASVRHEHGATLLDWIAYSEDSLLLKLEATCAKEAGEVLQAISPCPLAVAQKLIAPTSVVRKEPNVLLLDTAAFQINGGALQPRQEILKLDNVIRAQLGFIPRGGRMREPWMMEEKEHHKITLHYEIYSEVEVQVQLAMEAPHCCTLSFNGLPVMQHDQGYYVDPSIRIAATLSLQKGDNLLCVECDYHQKTDLENLYLLGEFFVNLQGTTPVIQPLHNRISLGDITCQGLPFYTGNLEYTFDICIPCNGNYCVHVPHFSAPLLSVAINGKQKGLIAYAPHRLELGRLQQGNHTLTITLFGNRFNGFGTLHNANDNYIWYGNDSYRTTGDEWSDLYLVRPVGLLSAVEIEQTTI